MRLRTRVPMILRTPAAVGAALLLLLSSTTPPSTPVETRADPVPSWFAVLGVSVDRVRGDPAVSLEAGALREGAGGRGLAVGARLLFVRESLACVGLGPCPDGSYQPIALGLHAEQRHALLPPAGEGPVRVWGGPRAGVLLGGGIDATVLEFGGSLGVDAQLGDDLVVTLAARGGGLVRVVSGGGERTTPVVGVSGAFRWRP